MACESSIPQEAEDQQERHVPKYLCWPLDNVFKSDRIILALSEDLIATLIL